MAPHVFPSGPAALAWLRSAAAPAIELGLIDMQMPDMDGAQVVAAARQDSFGSDILYILVSSLDGLQDDTDGLFAHKLVKPVLTRRKSFLAGAVFGDVDAFFGNQIRFEAPRLGRPLALQAIRRFEWKLQRGNEH